MKPVIHNNTTKIGDVSVTTVSKRTIEYLTDVATTYRDTVLKEHLIGITDEELVSDEAVRLYGLPKSVVKEIKHLILAATLRDVAYIRFTS